jgi:very-short-patch-repair endonuclease
MSLSSTGRKRIYNHIENHFDKMIYDLLGQIPDKNKRIYFASKKPAYNLLNLFIEALGNRQPSAGEKDTARSLIDNAHNYISSLKEKTKSSIVERLNDLIEKGKGRAENKHLSNIISEEMDKAKTHLEMITGTEATRMRNTAVTKDIERVGRSMGIEDPYCYFTVVKDAKTCKHCINNHLMADKVTPKVFKLSEVKKSYLSTEERKSGEISTAGQHPHCFIDRNTKVYTEHKGYLNIDQIKIGDRVLTHTGKFKKVINTLEKYEKLYSGNIINIKFKSEKTENKKGYSEFNVTPEHLFMTQRGWVRADELKTTDKFKQLYNQCSNCENIIPVKYGRKRYNKYLNEHFCSSKCVTAFQWKNKEHRENISEKSSMQMKKVWESPSVKVLNSLYKAQEKTRSLQSQGEFWCQKENRKDECRKNVAKINSNFQKNNPSKEELVFLEILREIYPETESNPIVGKFCVDFLLNDKKVIIEYDGGGHYFPVYVGKFSMESFINREKGRDNYLNKLGYHVLRYKIIPSKDLLINDIERVANNSKNLYSFKNTDILEIKTKQAVNKKLYDLTVEEDESFIANGVISHNCRCTLSYLSPGFAFKDGRLSWIGIGHDEYKKQREE